MHVRALWRGSLDRACTLKSFSVSCSSLLQLHRVVSMQKSYASFLLRRSHNHNHNRNHNHTMIPIPVTHCLVSICTFSTCHTASRMMLDDRTRSPVCQLWSLESFEFLCTTILLHFRLPGFGSSISCNNCNVLVGWLVGQASVRGFVRFNVWSSIRNGCYSGPRASISEIPRRHDAFACVASHKFSPEGILSEQNQQSTTAHVYHPILLSLSHKS